MTDINERLKELKKYKNRIVTPIMELNTNDMEMKQKITNLEKENKKLG